VGSQHLFAIAYLYSLFAGGATYAVLSYFFPATSAMLDYEDLGEMVSSREPSTESTSKEEEALGTQV
jgi:hypothetical protein